MIEQLKQCFEDELGPAVIKPMLKFHFQDSRCGPNGTVLEPYYLDKVRERKISLDHPYWVWGCLNPFILVELDGSSIRLIGTSCTKEFTVSLEDPGSIDVVIDDIRRTINRR